MLPLSPKVPKWEPMLAWCQTCLPSSCGVYILGQTRVSPGRPSELSEPLLRAIRELYSVPAGGCCVLMWSHFGAFALSLPLLLTSQTLGRTNWVVCYSPKGNIPADQPVPRRLMRGLSSSWRLSRVSVARCMCLWTLPGTLHWKDCWLLSLAEPLWACLARSFCLALPAPHLLQASFFWASSLQTWALLWQSPSHLRDLCGGGSDPVKLSVLGPWFFFSLALLDLPVVPEEHIPFTDNAPGMCSVALHCVPYPTGLQVKMPVMTQSLPHHCHPGWLLHQMYPEHQYRKQMPEPWLSVI